MIRVAVCDDVREVIMQLKDYLLEYQELKGQRLDIKSFYNAEDLFDYLKKNDCDLILLDIELVKMNGVELGQLIRNELNDHSTQIVYISAKNSYDRQLFDVQPLNFLPKPIDKSKLFKSIDLTAFLMKGKERVFVFENKPRIYRIKLNDILYFESFDHYYKVVTMSGTYEFKSTLSEIMEQISDSRLIQVHRSYIINYDNSAQTKYEEVIMSNGDRIPISRDRRKAVKKIFIEWGENII